MGNVKVNLKDLEKLRDRFEKLNNQIPDFIKELTNEIAGRLLRGAKKNTPVDNGILRRGWTIGEIVETENGYTVEVINPVEYARYVEYGHRTSNHKGWVKGQFMLTIAKKDLESNLEKVVSNKMKKFFKNEGGGTDD